MFIRYPSPKLNTALANRWYKKCHEFKNKALFKNNSDYLVDIILQFTKHMRYFNMSFFKCRHCRSDFLCFAQAIWECFPWLSSMSGRFRLLRARISLETEMPIWEMLWWLNANCDGSALLYYGLTRPLGNNIAPLDSISGLMAKISRYSSA